MEQCHVIYLLYASERNTDGPSAWNLCISRLPAASPGTRIIRVGGSGKERKKNSPWSLWVLSPKANIRNYYIIIIIDLVLCHISGYFDFPFLNADLRDSYSYYSYHLFLFFPFLIFWMELSHNSKMLTSNCRRNKWKEKLVCLVPFPSFFFSLLFRSPTFFY